MLTKFNRGATLAAIAAATLMLGACGTTLGGRAKLDPAPKVGGDYLVTHYEGVTLEDGTHSKPVAWTSVQFRQLQELDRSCHEQVLPQLPNKYLAAGKEALYMGVGDAIGVAAGATAAFPLAKWRDYFLYGAGAGAGAGFTGGLSAEEKARRYAIATCMYLQTGFARQLDAQLTGIGIIPWGGATRTRGVSDPGGAAVTPAKKGGQDQAPPPPGS